MIVSCPGCSARYDVADAAIAGGRDMRCSSCRAAWHQNDDGNAVGVVLQEAHVEEAEDTTPEAAPATGRELVPVTTSTEIAVIRPEGPMRPREAFRRTERQRRPSRVFAVSAAGGAILAASLIGLTAWHMVVPSAQSAPVYRTPILTVMGMAPATRGRSVQVRISNPSPVDTAVPSIQITVMDAAGASIGMRTLPPPIEKLAPGTSMEASIPMSTDPRARNVRVGFQR